MGHVTVVAAALLLAAAAALPPPAGVWREAPEYLPLFAPAGPRGAAYRAFVSTLPLPAVLRRLAAEPALLRAPGAWQPGPQLPADAFGQAGRYDRWKLLRLYGARQPVVARGPAGRDGQVQQAWTLVSPYPTVDLARLEPGTLLIVLSLDGS